MPRLPPPGKTSVIAMPGEVANLSTDDAQVGAGPQFRAGEQVRGQQFIPRDAEPHANEVGRASQTYDGETVPGNAITDKNIIFADGPVTNTDDMQAGSAPAFTRGETRDQRKLREYSEGMGANNQTQGLPDNRQRAGGVPIDAQTEAYAKGERLGELRIFGDKPFSSERIASLSRSGKTPGATIEAVDGGFAVRMPVDKPKPTPSQHDGEGELRLYGDKLFATLRMAQASRSGKTPGAKIEEVEGGYAIRMPVEKAPTAEPQTVATENGLTKDESAELIQRMLADDSAGGHVMSIFRAAHGTPEERRMYGAQYRPVLNAHRAKSRIGAEMLNLMTQGVTMDLRVMKTRSTTSAKSWKAQRSIGGVSSRRLWSVMLRMNSIKLNLYLSYSLNLITAKCLMAVWVTISWR